MANEPLSLPHEWDYSGAIYTCNACGFGTGDRATMNESTVCELRTLRAQVEIANIAVVTWVHGDHPMRDDETSSLAVAMRELAAALGLK